MRIARVQIAEVATPVLALVVDGAVYDVTKLELLWGLPADFGGGDFHTRVVAARCAGLAEIEARLTSGPRPSEARLLPGDILPLPPCDTERCSYLQIGPHELGGGEPSFEQRDSRSLVGDGQPVAVALEGGQQAALEVGLAAVVGDEIWRAGAREAERAVLGYTLLLDWWDRVDGWTRWRPGARAPSQLGAHLLTGIGFRTLTRAEALLRLPAEERRLDFGAWRYQPGELLAWLSQRVRLCPGDVVGLGRLAPAESLAAGDRVSLGLTRWLQLEGWATQAPPPGPWREG